MPKGKKGFQKGKNNPSVINGPWNLNKKTPKEVIEKLRDSHRGYVMPQNQKDNISKANKGKKNSKEHNEKIKRNHAKYWLGKKNPNVTGKNNSGWKGGISNNPYPKEFNTELKLKIRQRDNFTCCLCGKTEREELEELNRVLCVNHIDFDKNNCKESNLNTLCLRCNVKINREREYWIEYFKMHE